MFLNNEDLLRSAISISVVLVCVGVGIGWLIFA
jgi:hypothetical protein